jgi:hypothetical protein
LRVGLQRRTHENRGSGMTSGRRVLTAIVVWLVAAAMMASPAVSGPRPKKAPKVAAKAAKGIEFNKPTAMQSFSPLRTAVGTVYSIQDGETEPPDNEWSGEPSIAVDNKGTIYIAGTCCVGPAAPVWYSNDNGKTFREMETPGHLREWGIGAEGDLAVDNDGHVFFIDTYIPGLMASRWSDNGETWDYTMPAAGVVPGFDDRPWITWGNDSLYLYVNHVSHTAVYRSDDGGQTWTTGAPLSWQGDMTGQPFFPAHLAADRKTGTLWVSGIVESDGETVIGNLVSTDGGQTFSESVVSQAQRDGGFSPIFTGMTTVDEKGTGYVAWSTFDKEGCDVYYAASTNNGKSWNKPVRLNTGKGSCATFPWIQATEDGKLAAVWYETPSVKPAPAGEKVLRALTAGGTIYGNLEIPLAPQDELSEDAPWYLETAFVHKASSAKPAITRGRVQTETPLLKGPLGRELWDFLQVDIGPDNRIHIAYVEKYEDSAPETWYVSSKSKL